MAFIDIHSHILYGVDDGSKDLEESLSLLNQEKENGVDSVICTPHFYPHFSDFEEKLKLFNATFENLKSICRNSDLPQLFLGSEVHYFLGISHSSDLEKFAINNTPYLLLELPFLTPIPKEAIKEIISISEDLGFRVILAHIERYSHDKQYKNLLKLVKYGIVSAQINADSIFSEKLKKPVIKLLKKNLISFVASDTHSVDARPVKIKDCLNIIKSEFPASYHRIINETDIIFNEIKETSYA